MQINLFKILQIFKNIYKKDENNREVNIYKTTNTNLTGHSLFYPNILLKTDNELILPLLERTMSLKIGTIYEKQNMQYEYVKNKMNNEYSIPLFFFIYNTDNYFHFIYDTLPYLISYFELKKDIPDIKLLMQFPNPQKQEMYKFQVVCILKQLIH